MEHQEWLNPLLVVLASQSVQSLLLGSIAGNGLGLVVIGVLNITVFFVFAEVAPKTWAILHTERAALLSARPVAALASFPPLRWLSRGLIGLTNGSCKVSRRDRSCRRRSCSPWPTWLSRAR